VAACTALRAAFDRHLLRRRQPPCPTSLPAREGCRSLYFRASSDASPTKVEDMVGIILEGVLFVALLATVAALLFYALLRWTPLGLRLKQDANRRKIEQTLELECPIHGLQREEELVRLPSGSRICPTCYKEALHE
jgi:hypothetical protein